MNIKQEIQKLYTPFRQVYSYFSENIGGIEKEKDRRWYTAVVLSRLIFIHFLQLRGFIDDGNCNYLQYKFADIQRNGQDRYYSQFLRLLFFEGFAKPFDQRNSDVRSLLGKVPYLNSSFFLPHPIEERYSTISIPDAVFEKLFVFLENYSQDHDDVLDVLGNVFEMYINEEQFGPSYIPPEITNYLCERTIHKLILDKMTELNQSGVGNSISLRFHSVGDLLLKLDAAHAQQLLNQVLPEIKVLDPACGSGKFLIAALETFSTIYQLALCRISSLNDKRLKQWLAKVDAEHPNRDCFVKKQIITHNLFGVDIMPEAAEIARLRLLLALVSSLRSVQELELLPNLEFNILAGNSLVGILWTKMENQQYYQSTSFDNKKISEPDISAKLREYRNLNQEGQSNPEVVRALRDEIEQQKKSKRDILNRLFLDEFRQLRIKYEQVTWDLPDNKPGQPSKRELTLADIEELQPFHWGSEFAEIIKEQGGFDVIIVHPPWGIFKPQEAEFFAKYLDETTFSNMTTQGRRKEQQKLLHNKDIRDRWLVYLSQFPHQIEYFRKAKQYQRQNPAGSNIDLYKLFTEQCYNLLRDGGKCGTLLPAGIYTDFGAIGLRKMLFEDTQIDGLFGFENGQRILENVHSSFKFVALTFTKAGQTKSFPTAFRRQNVAELANFPDEGAVFISTDFINRLSPKFLSVVEIDQDFDVEIAEKLLQFPLLAETIDYKWNLRLMKEFHLSNDSNLFKSDQELGSLPLYEGRMIDQFYHRLNQPRYWIDEKQGRMSLLGRETDTGQELVYQNYRIGIRTIASKTDRRTLISTVLPPNVFCSHSIALNLEDFSNHSFLLICSALLNSFVVDWIARLIIGGVNLDIDQLPVPRLIKKDRAFDSIAERAAKLICTTPEFNDLAREVGLGNYKNGVTDPVQRVALRAELDGLIAHIYGLTEAEFSHILNAFPLVAAEVKAAALAAYRRFAPDPEVMALIAGGESERVEFKVAARRNPYTGKDEGQKMSDNIVKAVAGMMNGAGGTLLIGVADDGAIKGVAVEYDIINKSKPTWDGYRLFLEGVLKEKLSTANAFQFYQLSRHEIEGKAICRITVSPAPGPVYVDKKLYVRTGNQTSELQGPDLMAYVQSRW